MTVTPNQSSDSFRRLAAASAFASLFALAIILTITPAALNQIRPICHNSDALVGWLFRLSMAAFVACVLLGGRYSDRRGKLPILFVGGILMAVGSFMFARISTFPLALVAMILMGAGSGFTEGIAMGIVAEVFRADRRTSMMNCAQVFYAIGAVVCPLAVAWLLAANIDWHLAYYATTICCVIGAFTALGAIMKHGKMPPKREESGDWKALLMDRRVLVLSLGIMLYVGAEGGQGNWLAAYFKDDMGTAGPLAAASVALFWAGIGLGRATTAWTSRHLSDYTIICWSLGFAAICQTALLIFNTSIPALIAVPLLGFGLAPVWPTIVSRASALHPSQSGTVLGMVVAAGAIGSGLFPPAIGQAADVFGLRHALWTCLVLIIINLGIFITIRKRYQTR